MKRIGITLAAFLMASAAAQAADLGWNGGGSSAIYSPTPVSGWSGFYAGVNGDYGFGGVTRRATIGGPTTENNTNGAAFGAQAGYNLDMGGFVLGTEADLQWSGIGYSEAVGADTFKSSVDFFGTVRGRAGMSFGQVMPYVTGGFAAGRGTASLTNAGGVTTSQSATHMGWTLGAGLEAKATDNISFKAEYLYVDLGTQSYNGLPAPIGNQDVSQRFSVVRAGINYKF
ncbi:outer membrane immunogenic protein [Devosia sp. YR412]|uniref:outer membrane protein n=1 Tax=Devosia sp. YR412 TaxID=1881030 RepID=UPI0008B1C297|nr:outer membrane protein [Devosia sp. YR412]SEQ29978.1 outer membrane immunogenic protein [Devosia sp. YR412]